MHTMTEMIFRMDQRSLEMGNIIPEMREIILKMDQRNNNLD